MRTSKGLVTILVTILSLAAVHTVTAQSITATVRFAESLREGPQDGRLLLILATDKESEPRFQVRFNLSTQPIFGQDVEGWEAETTATFNDQQRGFPIKKISDLPPGEYQVQAVLNRYHTYDLSNGKTVKLPKDQWEGQQWQKKPGNFYSLPQTVIIDGKSDLQIDVVMDQKMPVITPPEDTKYVKHIRMKSELLSEFWGEPVYLGAHVLIPHGFDDHPDARFPLMIFHGHFPHDLWGFRTTPPDFDEPPVYSERFGVEAYNHVQQQEAYDFYRKWISDDFPRYLVIEIQHPTPYYDDSYAVNSASQGPYGDALTYELIPYIEKEFRGIGEGWSRFTYGGSTGGWEALAVQIFYPDEYNGAFVACPDPIDFRAFTNINIYEDENAYYDQGDFMKLARPGHRDYLGHISFTQAAYNHLELVLGTKSRSGQQYDIWEATYSPMGADGYPQRIWDKETGKIDRTVAAYWRENYDLRYILERDWDKIGEKLKGKIFIYTGDMDNYYLNNAVYLMEEFLESTNNPYYGGDVDYGDRAEHCWNGDQANPNHISRLRYNTMYLPKILKRIQDSAPPGADVTSWRY